MKEILYLSHLSEGENDIGLRDFSLTVFAGQCICLVGIHGSGKSSVKKLLSGKLIPSSGSVFLHEKKVSLTSKGVFKRAGVRVLNSRQALVGTMSIRDNLFLLRESNKHRFWYNIRAAESETAEILREYSIRHAPSERVDRLSQYEKSLLCIAKAVSYGAKLLVLDIAGIALSSEQICLLGQQITRLKAKGIACLIIEDDSALFLNVADRVVVMQDGKDIKTFYDGRVDYNSIACYLTSFPQIGAVSITEQKSPSEIIMQIWRGSSLFLPIARGSITGIFDTQQDFGRDFRHYLLLMAQQNRLHFADRENRIIPLDSPQEVIFIPENSARRLLETLSIGDNLILPARQRTSSRPGLISRPMRQFLQEEFYRLAQISGKPQRIQELAYVDRKLLSIYRWVLAKPSILLLSSPTAGLDNDARKKLFHYLSALSQAGIAIFVTEHSCPALGLECDKIIFAKGMQDLQIGGLMEKNLSTEGQ